MNVHAFDYPIDLCAGVAYSLWLTLWSEAFAKLSEVVTCLRRDVIEELDHDLVRKSCTSMDVHENVTPSRCVVYCVSVSVQSKVFVDEPLCSVCVSEVL